MQERRAPTANARNRDVRRCFIDVSLWPVLSFCAKVCAKNGESGTSAATTGSMRRGAGLEPSRVEEPRVLVYTKLVYLPKSEFGFPR